MTRLQGSIGETKLKILAIIYFHNVLHGYGIWSALKETFHIYLDEQNRRNVYHHLHDLCDLGLVKSCANPLSENSSTSHPYRLTEEGKTLEQKFRKYLNLL